MMFTKISAHWLVLYLPTYLCFWLELRMFYAQNVVASAWLGAWGEVLFWLSTSLAVPFEAWVGSGQRGGLRAVKVVNSKKEKERMRGNI